MAFLTFYSVNVITNNKMGRIQKIKEITKHPENLIIYPLLGS